MAFFRESLSRKDLLFNKVVEYLDSQQWKYTIKGERDFIEFNMGLKGKISSCRMVVLASDKEIQSMAFAPIKASTDSFGTVVEFITRANYGLKVGKFEFDYRDGEVRYQACLPCREGMPSMSDIEFVVDLPMMMLQRYGDGLVKNLMGFGTPEADIRAIEG